MSRLSRDPEPVDGYRSQKLSAREKASELNRLPNTSVETPTAVFTRAVLCAQLMQTQKWHYLDSRS